MPIIIDKFVGWEFYTKTEAEAIAEIQRIVDNPPPTKPDFEKREYVKFLLENGGTVGRIIRKKFSGKPELLYDETHPDDTNWNYPLMETVGVPDGVVNHADWVAARAAR